MPEHQSTMPEASLDARLEAVLFASGNPMKHATLMRALGCTEPELAAATAELKARLKGLVLLETDRELGLATAPSVAETVAAMRSREWEGELGEAGLEVLSIILYRKGATRAAIEYIRGVNSAATLRTLQMRGLIERMSGSEGNATFTATADTFAHLGITHETDLPEYEATVKELAEFEARAQEAAAGTEEIPQ